MKRRVYPLALALVLMVFFCACGGYDAEKSTIFVDKDGTVTETSVEKMDQSYYSESELESFITEEIAEFESTEGTVEETGYEMEDGTATLTLTYSNWKTYADFNRRIFYTGTVVKAQAEGFDFDTTFTKTEDGTTAAIDEVLEIPERKIVVLETSIGVNIKVPGRILYVSDHVTTDEKDKGLATVEKSKNESMTELAYIIYN